ncbi:MAG: FAD binding domain-containing protein [Gammaproteobacteria bacterium]
MAYALPATIEEALSLRAAGDSVIIAGGTDIYPAAVDRSLRDKIIDISGVSELSGFEANERNYRFGALTTWTQVLKANLPPAFDALKLAAREVGSVQIQNVATVLGNICNASPAADGVPPLLALNAAVEIRSSAGLRTVPLCDFILGNRETTLNPNEIATAILIPRDIDTERSNFIKLGARKYLVISIAMVAANVSVDAHERIASAKIAVGSCAAVAQRLPALEKSLIGLAKADIATNRLNEEHLHDVLSPIDDIRASKLYRLHAARVLIARAIRNCLGESS